MSRVLFLGCLATVLTLRSLYFPDVHPLLPCSLCALLVALDAHLVRTVHVDGVPHLHIPSMTPPVAHRLRRALPPLLDRLTGFAQQCESS